MRKAKILAFFIIAAAFFNAYAAATLVHPIPQSNLKKRKPLKPLPPPHPFLPIFNREQKQYLYAHNILRQNLGVPPLAWDANLTASAHAWAVERHGDCNYRLHSPNRFGENLFWMDYNAHTPAQIVQSWFSEQQFYDPVRNVCRCVPERNGCECGHYLNVVWRTTKRVGCSGAVYCGGDKGVYVVCQYDPAGLIKGANPFAAAGEL